MLRGRFGDTTGRPYIEGRLILPRLSISGDISFLVDTGADTSVLVPADALRLSVPYSELDGDREVGGIGGSAHCYIERAILVFTEPNVALYAYDLQLDVMPVDPSAMDCLSILGRDVLDQWRITYDPSNAKPRFRLRAEVKSAGFTFDLTQKAQDLELKCKSDHISDTH